MVRDVVSDGAEVRRLDGAMREGADQLHVLLVALQQAPCGRRHASDVQWAMQHPTRSLKSAHLHVDDTAVCQMRGMLVDLIEWDAVSEGGVAGKENAHDRLAGKTGKAEPLE